MVIVVKTCTPPSVVLSVTHHRQTPVHPLPRRDRAHARDHAHGRGGGSGGDDGGVDGADNPSHVRLRPRLERSHCRARNLHIIHG